ncbi:MAG TPA: hypothetical protein VMY88_00110 [Acidimicrobiales bacterium]|nr:hypothetical protein [Acidimicrobiales bacterium]
MNRLTLGISVLGLTGLGVAGVAWYVKRRPVSHPGYVVAANCGGVTVTDEAQALAFAESRGAQACTFVQAASAEWVANASASLSVPLICEAAKAEDAALGFAYRLLRAYVRGALTAGKIDEPSAVNVVADLRKLMLDNGVPPALLPEGVPGVPKPSPKPGPPPGPKQIDQLLTPAQREAEACGFAVANRPKTYGGLSQSDYPDTPLAGWLGLVAYRRAYPDWPTGPVQPAQVEALSRVITCVTEKLYPPVPVPVDTPTPGKHYQTRATDTDLLALASRAYKTVNGSPANLAAARVLSNHPDNRRFHSAHPTEIALYPPSGRRIDVSPVFGPPVRQVKDPEDGARGEGNYFPLIFIPELP